MNDPRNIWKKAVTRGAASTGNIAGASVAAVASVALANPLPAILYGVGAGAWLLYRAQSTKLHAKLYAEERAKEEDRAVAARDQLRHRVEGLLGGSPFVEWIDARLFPNYIVKYEGLVDTYNRIQRLAHDREDVGLGIEEDIRKQVDGMLTSYLRFVQSRMVYTQILTGTKMGAAPKRARRSGGRGGTPEAPQPQARLEAIRRKIAFTKQRAETEPALKTQLESAKRLLEEQQRLLEECHERDQRVAIQLDTFPTMFEVIFARLNLANQFQADVLTQDMERMVASVEETQRFTEELRASLGSLLDGTDGDLLAM